jgi:transcriptional regulator with XRE-family HTH domain
MMTNALDYSIASSEQIKSDLCKRLEQIRLTRNITQARLADEAGLSLRTIRNLESGQGVSLDTFIRVLIALGIQQNLQVLLPDPRVRPIDRVALGGKERLRASSKRTEQEETQWVWGDENKDTK